MLSHVSQTAAWKMLSEQGRPRSCSAPATTLFLLEQCNSAQPGGRDSVKPRAAGQCAAPLLHHLQLCSHRTDRPCFPPRLPGPAPAAWQAQQPCLPRAGEAASPPQQEEQGKGKPKQESLELWSESICTPALSATRSSLTWAVEVEVALPWDSSVSTGVVPTAPGSLVPLPASRAAHSSCPTAGSVCNAARRF